MPLTSVKKLDDSVLRKLEEIIDPDWTNLVACCGRIVMKSYSSILADKCNTNLMVSFK